LVGQCDDVQGTDRKEWVQIVRVHPKPGKTASLEYQPNIPDVVKTSLKEAEKCGPFLNCQHQNDERSKQVFHAAWTNSG